MNLTKRKKHSQKQSEREKDKHKETETQMTEKPLQDKKEAGNKKRIKE